MTSRLRQPLTIDALADLHGDVQVMPTSFGQQRFWVLDQLDESAAYTLPIGVRLQGRLNVDALHRALNHIVARHEALRTVFALEGDEPVQVVLPALEIELTREDLRAEAANTRESSLQALADANANTAFDLAAGPLIRAALVQMADDEHVLLLSLHHIAADGTSIGILFGELEAAYTALASGTDPELAPLALQYPDFAVWQRRAMQGGAAARQVAYWTDRLRALTPLELPTDRPRPAMQTQNGSHCELAIDGEVAEGIRALARREGATPYMGFLTAFFALLHRYSSQTDLVIGSITAGRLRPEVEPVIGLFLNTLAIRAEVSPNSSFVELLRIVRDSTTAAYANQDVPFEHVVDAVQPTRDQSRSPVFQVAFQLLESLARDLKLPGLTASRVSGSKHSAKFDLTLMLHAAPRGGIRAVLEYNTDLYDRATIQHMLSHYATLLAGVTRDSGATIGRLPLMGAEEYAQVTEAYNATSAPLPQWSVPERVLANAKAHPDIVAVQGSDGSLTFGELAARSAVIASQLTAQGIGSGDRVAVFMDRTSAMVAALLGVHRSGAAYVPLDTAYPADRLAHVFQDAAVRAVLTDHASRAMLPPLDATVLLVDELVVAANNNLADATTVGRHVSPESPAYVIYTSGSTGKPKGVVIPHRALANFLDSMAERPGLAAGDAVVAVTTVAFDIAGLELWLPLCVGATVHIASRAVATDGIALRDLVVSTAAARRDARVLVQATPATWTLLIEAGWNGSPNVIMLCGGEAWPPKLAAALLPRGEALWNVYGPTETTIWSSRHRVTRADDVPLGEPLANTTLLVLEPSGEPAALGVPGELWIGGAGLALGYHNLPQQTAERFVEHARYGRLYRTGDRVRRRNDGALVYQGRLDDQVKLRGYRIELGDIESVLASQPGVAQAVVALRTDSGTPRIVAYVVLAAGSGDEGSKLSLLMEPLRRALPEYMVPSSIVALQALPLSPAGKVDRRALPAPDASVTAEREFVAPRTPLEEQIASVWRIVLEQEHVSIDDDFFALGGHSLLAMRVVARLADVLPVRLTIGALFEARTVAALAELVTVRLLDSAPDSPEKFGDTHAHEIQPRMSDAPAQLSFAQELLWLYEQMTPGTAAYNVPMVRRVRGPLKLQVLQQALDALVERHESLRTTFLEVDGVPFQHAAAPSTVPIDLHDLRHVPASERETQASALLQQAAMRAFDLAQPTHPRVVVVTLADDEAVLLVVVHHAVFDGASTGVLLTELAALYNGVLTGTPSTLAPLRIQLADFATWERDALSGERLQSLLEYWRSELDGAPSGIDLPLDYARPPGAVGPGARTRVMIPAATRDALRAVASAHGVTLFMSLLAGFQALMYRYSRQSDFVVGTVVAGRTRPGTENLVGYLSNTLALRARVDATTTFADLQAQARDRMLRAFDHQDVPYEQLVRELRAGKAAAEQALFSVLFTLQDSGVPVSKFGTATLEPLGLDLGAAKFDIAVSAAEQEQGIEVVVEYRSDLFAPESIALMLSHFTTLLNAASRDAQSELNRLPLMESEEYTRVTETLNASAAPLPQWTLPERVLTQAQARPQAIAVRGESSSITYGDLAVRSAALAAHMTALGVGPGDRVAVAMDRTPEMVVALLAVHRTGAAYVPLDTNHPSERLGHVLSDAGVQLVLSDVVSHTRLPVVTVPVVNVGILELSASNEQDAFALPALDRRSPAYVIYTSGSTGKPKGVAVPHNALANFLSSMAGRPGLDAHDALVAVTTVSFDIAGLELWLPLTTGARVELASRHIASDGSALRTLLDDTAQSVGEGRVMLQATPATWNLLLEAEWSGTPNAVMLCGGEAWPPGLASALLTRGQSLWNVYGPTETTIWSARHRVETADDVHLGEPVANTTLLVLEPTGEPAPLSVAGELWIGGEGLALGYHDRADLTAERFVETGRFGRLYRTGDRVRRRFDGALEYLGRLDDQVKLRGYRIELGDIESVIAAHPDVSGCVVVLRQNAAVGAQLVGYCIGERGPVNRAEIRAWAAARLPDYMVPALIVSVDAFPLSPAGKVDRKAFPEPTSLDQDAVPMTAPRNDIEYVLASIWCEVLGLPQVDVGANFLEIGGHSLLATRVVSQVTKVFRTRLSLRSFFDDPTIAGVARALVADEVKTGQTASIAALLRKLQSMSPEEREMLRRRQTASVQSTATR